MMHESTKLKTKLNLNRINEEDVGYFRDVVTTVMSF